MPGLFANEKLNTGRQDELDIVKGLAERYAGWKARRRAAAP